MQGHYGSLAADTTGHSLDLQYWHDRQPIQVSPNTPPTIRNSDILDQDFSWNQIAAALLQMSPRKAPGDDGWVPRKREECVGQVVSLVDIIQRRQNAGLNTHVLFIDIRKAFDTVPVGALLWKLQNMGFPRRTLAFLKALYTSSSARARAGHYYRTHSRYREVSDRDVHCLDYYSIYSSTTFSMVSHPSQSLDYRETRNPIRGLMYADDVAVFADSEQSLLAASTAIEQWANQWEMQFGVAKCGIISFTGHLVSTT
ncbi:hypothetical protein BASA83_012842 [Batrachochytrium salamandrivorans]|nr:hypothetical protein BASA83_012842 [Batrachochytrium salamandrivorans]